jgi:aspartyl-tRNA(Asn)/glutamyl-tRNA(Gln) amidotransferase subunit A
MMNLNELTIKEFHSGLAEKKFSAKEVTGEFLKAITAKDGEIGAYLSVFGEGALEAASAVDEKIASGGVVSEIAGVPIALKDNMLVKGTKTTAASRMLEDYVASYDATVVGKLKDNNAVLLGKANMDEFAMGSSTEYSAFKTTKNPYDPTRVPGGSSGGSAAAVAAGLAMAALGSDTSGSICLPASFCGIVGLRPTYGAVSRSGLIAMASSLDQIGPMAKTVEDAEMLFRHLAGKDALDSTTVDHTYEEIKNLDDLKGLKIGLPKEFFVSGLSGEVEEGIESAVQRFKKLGIEFKEIELPHAKYALSCYYIIMPAEVSSNLARFDGVRYQGVAGMKNEAKSLSDLYLATRGTGFGPEPRRRILLGTFVLSAGYYDAYYAKAQKVRHLIKNDFDEAFKKVDVIMAPVAPAPAFKFGEKISDPMAMYLSDIFTTQTNLAGIPALSVPVKKYNLGGGELPVGFQLIGNRFEENRLFALGKLYERN